MSRRLWLNLALTAIVLGLGVWLWWFSQRSPSPAETPPPRVTTLAPDTITSLRVRRAGDLFTLARHDDRWRLTTPVAAPADKAHLDVLLGLAHARAARRLAQPGDDQITGLGDDAVIVQYNDRPPIRIGGPGPVRGTRYVRTPHATLLVPVPHFATLDWHWTDWLDRSLIAPDRHLTRLVLPRHTLTPDPPEGWQAAPDGASDRAAAATIAAWQRAQALMIVPADARRARIARVTLYFENAPTRYLDVIETAPHLILRDPSLGVDYHLAGNRVAPLLDLVHPIR